MSKYWSSEAAALSQSLKQSRVPPTEVRVLVLSFHMSSILSFHLSFHISLCLTLSLFLFFAVSIY